MVLEDSVEGWLEGSRGGRVLVRRTRRWRSRRPRYTTIGDSTDDRVHRKLTGSSTRADLHRNLAQERGARPGRRHPAKRVTGTSVIWWVTTSATWTGAPS